MPVPLLQAFVATIIEMKARNLMMGTMENVIKVPFKTNNAFNSTMMPLFLAVIIVSKKNKQVSHKSVHNFEASP